MAVNIQTNKHTGDIMKQISNCLVELRRWEIVQTMIEAGLYMFWCVFYKQNHMYKSYMASKLLIHR